MTLDEGQDQYYEHVTPTSEAVTVPSLMMTTLIVSKESLARDARTHACTHTHTHARTHTATHARTHARVCLTDCAS